MQDQIKIKCKVDKVENCGNDILEIHCDCSLNEKVLSLIRELHCRDNNKSVICIFKKQEENMNKEMLIEDLEKWRKLAKENNQGLLSMGMQIAIDMVNQLDEAKVNDCEFAKEDCIFIELSSSIIIQGGTDMECLHKKFICNKCGHTINAFKLNDILKTKNYCPNCGRKIKKGE